MENKINIAELLKNCSQGMELDCAIFENVVLDEVNFEKDPNYPIRIVTKSGTMLSLSKYGTYIEDTDSKCVIFPKGKTTWEGFVPPCCQFKDGDIIFAQYYDLKYIAIVKQIDKLNNISVHCLYGFTGAVFAIDEFLGILNEALEIRFATKEEKQKLFDTIKENGYYWSQETKTLDKLPKFKDGDKIKDTHNNSEGIVEKINIAELLRDCPKGMELDCTVFNGKVCFEGIDTNNPRYPIIISINLVNLERLDVYGQYDTRDYANCIIFPKGKTTWEGFVSPCKFKDGDVVHLDFGHYYIITIFKRQHNEFLYYYALLRDDVLLSINDDYSNVCTSYLKEIRFATEEEKQKLFEAIKENGYYWRQETKTLEKLVESKEDTNDKVVMSDIYFDREYYDDEVELHLGNYEIEIRDGKTYAIFKNQETKTMEKLNKSEFKVGDRIKDTRNNSEGIIEKIDEENCTCLFDYGRFYFPIVELDYFELVPNKSDITSNMEEINVDWCKQHGMTLFKVNVASDTSYYLETNGNVILVYTKSTTGNQKLNVINPITNKEIEFSLSRLNRDLNKLNSITTDDLRKLCELVNLDYPFKS